MLRDGVKDGGRRVGLFLAPQRKALREVFVPVHNQSSVPSTRPAGIREWKREEERKGRRDVRPFVRRALYGKLEGRVEVGPPLAAWLGGRAGGHGGRGAVAEFELERASTRLWLMSV